MTNVQWIIEPHTLIKHEILRGYLGAWFPILCRYNQRVVYLDGFCGPGRYANGEDGSPIIALNEALKHAPRLQNNELTFLFIDERPDRIEQLKTELQGLNIPRNFIIRPMVGEFAQELQAGLDYLDSNGLQLAPTFAFVDPFGFKGIPFSLLRRLLKNPKTEVFINVMIDPINRFLEHPDAQVRQHIIDLFGTNQVLHVAQAGRDRLSALRTLYQQQLQKHAQFVRYFEMRDDRNKVIYYLFFATNHRLGHTKIKEAFWRVDKMSGFKFSDTTNPHQLVLFETDPSADLSRVLITAFAGHTIAVRKIRLFVEDQTPYTASHVKGALTILEEQGKACVSPCKANGQRRRKGTFPDDSTIEFQVNAQ
jgi:three-Cys-motif partner protein